MADKYAAPEGDDRNPGTEESPFRTVQKLVGSLRPGDVGNLRAGTYTEGDKRVLVRSGGAGPESRITVQNYPGEEAIIRAQVKVNPGADYVTFRSAPGERWSLVLDGTGGPRTGRPTNRGRFMTRASPDIQANNTEWLDLDVTKRNRDFNTARELEQTGVGFHLGKLKGARVAGTRIEGCRIHNHGPMADQPGGPDNHGIYVSNTKGTTLIRGNLIYDNGERGIQLYPNANGVVVEGNVVDGNGQGLVVDATSSNNTIRNNVFSNPRVKWNLYQGPGAKGKNNIVNFNCFWSKRGDAAFRDGSGIIASGNVTDDPHYRDRVSFEVTNPEVEAMLRS